MNVKTESWYKWVITAGCTILFACSLGLTICMITLFIKPMAADLSLPRTAVSLTCTFQCIGNLVASPISGKMFAKYRIKPLMFAGAIVSGVSLFLCSLTTSLWVICLLCVFMGISSSYFGLLPSQIILSNWFGNKRGAASGIVLTGSGISGMLLSTHVSGIIETAGWQAGFRFLGILSLCLSIPTILILIRVRPSRPVEAVIAETHEIPGLTFREAIRTKSFRLICIIGFLGILMGGPFITHMVSYLSDVGHTAAQAAQLYAIFSFTSIFGKIFLGLLYDKWGLKRGSIFVCSLFFAGMFLFLFSQNNVFAVISAVLFGISAGIQNLPTPLLISHAFGQREYGTIYGVVGISLILGNIVGSPAVAMVYDSLGSYRPAWIASLGITVVLLGLKLVFLRQGPLYKKAGQAETQPVLQPATGAPVEDAT